MRQAGRYLPEFRKIREKNQDFIKLCLNEELSSEITLQPIKRYNLDAAIIFSDILIIPYALGQKINFIKGKGPKLNNFGIDNLLNKKKNFFLKELEPVYKSISRTRKKLRDEKSLISFVGAPWTLMVYMLNLKTDENKLNLNLFKKNEKNLEEISNKLVEFSCIHIKEQIQAGANLIQVFDSWAGLLPNNYLEQLCFDANKKISDFCKFEKIPIICFPKGIKKKYKEFTKFVNSDGISLDYEIDPLWAKKNLNNVVIQGGMDPRILLETDDKIYREAKKYLDIFKDVPYIFNLGHGLIPETNPDKLRKLVEFVRGYK
tara:strand:- start:73 stop:1023 length:951 start_codon:yes stop_codon:yes gene_type:complete